VGSVDAQGAAIFQKRYLNTKDHIIYYYSKAPKADSVEGTWSWFPDQVGKDAFKISKVIPVDQRLADIEAKFSKETAANTAQIKDLQDRLAKEIKDR
jgi:hypothetical protein